MAVSTAMDGEEPFYNVDVNANGVGLITDCTGDSDATAGMSGSADMRVEPDLEKTGCTSASTLQPHPLTLDEREDSEDQLIAVRDEQLDRDEDPALVDLVYQLLEWLYYADTPELAEDAPATIPRLHNLWCGTRHFDLTIDVTASLHSSTAPLFGTRWCPSAGTGAGPRHAEEEIELVMPPSRAR